MSKHLRRMVLVVVPVAFCLAPAGPAAADDLVTAVGATKKVLPAPSATGEAVVVSFPMTLTADGAAAPTITPTVLDVVRGDVDVPDDVVTAAFDEANAQLELTVDDLEPFAVTGDYTVSLLLEGAGNRQSLNVTLSRPAARLTPGGTVQVQQVEKFRGEDLPGGDARHPRLEIAVERGAALSSLTARQAERSEGVVTLTADCHGENGENEQCPLTADQPVELANPVEGDGVLTLDYVPEGFPLGKTTRTVELRSPQLAAPVSLVFEVTRRREPLLIVLVVMIGLAVGVLVRKGLGRLVRMGQAWREVNDLRSVIAGLQSRYHDKVFRESLDDIDRQLAGNSPNVTALRKKTAEELKAANKRLDEARGSFNAYITALRVERKLPRPVAEELRELRRALAAVDKALTLWDGSKAESELAGITGQRAEDLATACKDWIDTYHQALTNAKAKLDEALHDGLTDLKSALGTAESKAEPPAEATMSPAELTKHLQVCHELMGHWARKIAPALRAAAEAYRNGNDDEADAVVQAADPPGNAPLDPSVQLTDANTHLIALLPVAGPTDAAPGVARHESEVQALEAEGPVEVPTSEVELPSYDGTLGDSLRLLPGRIGAFGLSWIAELVRFLVLAAILTAVAYGTLSSTWVGTNADIVALFGWAFALDVTVQAVTAAFGTASPTPPAGAAAGV